MGFELEVHFLVLRDLFSERFMLNRRLNVTNSSSE